MTILPGIYQVFPLKPDKEGEQDGGGVGGCGVHLSPWIHQEYTSDTEVLAEHQLTVDRT